MSAGLPVASTPLQSGLGGHWEMEGGLPYAFLLRGLRDQWDPAEIDRKHSQSIADPTNMDAPAEHRHVWLTVASAERIIGQPGYQVALLPAAIDEDSRHRPFRNLYRLQVFRKPAMDPREQATDFDIQCCMRVYHGGRLVCVVPYVPVKKGPSDKLCATCVVQCAGGSGICGKQNTFRNVVNSHMQKTHKLTKADLQERATATMPLPPMTVTNTPPPAFVFAGMVINHAQGGIYGSHAAAGTSSTDGEATPPSLDVLDVDGNPFVEQQAPDMWTQSSYMAPPLPGDQPNSGGSIVAWGSDTEDVGRGDVGGWRDRRQHAPVSDHEDTADT
ncbi:unnamed protein product [Vitrella brassicaformis CCMP3155]|uniref:Uncharacterized protein n=1 Tax=Vitrella brassicaformis (strain CCMP3155) TaxID=1169540 RepID=A0A0G4GYD3_VITBC|nr:unnamed protein product [Vitrella brassicaformis CCMP3155]|eukprot:CEM36119.1 unnamed protein product [Vitrella brassicaformis CCMP3155]